MKISLLSVLLAGLILGFQPAKAQSYQVQENEQALQSDVPESLQATSDEQVEFHGGPGPGRGLHPGPVHGPVHPGPAHGWGGPRPGWHEGWHWDYNAWHPHWWHVGFVFPGFVWLGGIPVGYWQCTAFNQNGQGFSDMAPTIDQASYGALYECGGPNYQGNACYVPQGYCQHRL